MGNSISEPRCDFAPTQVVEYRLGNRQAILWRGTSHHELLLQLETYLDARARALEAQIAAEGQPVEETIIISRDYGRRLGDEEKTRRHQLCEYRDLYIITYSIADRIGFAPSPDRKVTIDAARIVFGRPSPRAVRCFDDNYEAFTEAAYAAYEYLAHKTF